MKAIILASIANIIVIPIFFIIMGLGLILMLLLCPLFTVFCRIHPNPTKSWLIG
jgi:hypothetical protein